VSTDAFLAWIRDYYLAHTARANLYRRLGKMAEARVSYQRALNFARQEPARRFLERRLREIKEMRKLLRYSSESPARLHI
jgi:predicted RNA polymerase sigma factor